MRITEIVEFSKSKIKLILEDNTYLVIYKGMIDTASEDISDADLLCLSKDMTGYAKRRSMNLLLKRDYTISAMREKLHDDGYNPEIIDNVMNFLVDKHFIDDERTAEHIVRQYKGYKSKRELAMILKRKDVPEDIAYRALEDFYVTDDHEFSEDGEHSDTPQEMLVIEKTLRKLKITPESYKEMEFKEKQKILAKLYRKGFDSSLVNKALNI